MKKLIFLVFVIYHILFPTLLFSQDTPIISVLDFQASGISEAETRILVDYISSHVVDSGKYIVIDRMQRATILKEIEFSYSDCADEKCQIEIGRLLSATQIIVGSLGQIGERYLLNIKLIQVETGSTLNTSSAVFRSIEELIDNSKELTLRLIGEHESYVKKSQRPAVPEGFVQVEAGAFQRGSIDGDADEKPVHRVTLSRSFYMSKYEVTQKQWREVMGINPSHFRDDNLPVESVSWYDAVEYCNRLSRKEGLSPCFSGSGDNIDCDFSANGYRLPTEAEWEYAARGGNRSRGYTYSGSNSAAEVGWYSNNSGGKTHLVGQKRPNELGLYDLSGNVWEWCWDWYGKYSFSSQTDPAGPSSGSGRVHRGGCWYGFARFLRAADRDYGALSLRHVSLGFRLVRTAE